MSPLRTAAPRPAAPRAFALAAAFAPFAFAPFALAPAAAAAPVAAESQPRIWVANTAVDLGSAFQGTIKTHVVQVENRGDADLRIYRLISKCDCVTPALLAGDPPVEIDLAGLNKSEKEAGNETGYVIPPGGAAGIRLAFATGRMPGREFEKNVTVRSNDPVAPSLELSLRIEVRVPVDIQPRNAVFGDVRRGAGARQRITIRPAPEFAFDVVAVKPSGPVVQAVHEKRDLPDGSVSHLLDVTVPTDAPIGRFGEKILLETNSKDYPSIEITAYGKILSPIQYRSESPTSRRPDLIQLRGAGTGRRVEETVLIENLVPAVPYAIKSVRVDSPLGEQLTSYVETLEPGVRYRLYLRVAEGVTSEFFNGAAVLLSDHPDEPELAIPFQGGSKTKG